ncbi:hypothetical protein BC941DRAFT_424098 [Chlamydoabsidia padenii]|nr:hypothetical protein BC941DRAFT_424098 [Chlamydoabsidia padenii]
MLSMHFNDTLLQLFLFYTRLPSFGSLPLVMMAGQYPLKNIMAKLFFILSYNMPLCALSSISVLWLLGVL